LADVTVLAGSPLHIPLNASDAEGQNLSFSASSSNAAVSTHVPDGNRSLQVNVAGLGSMTFELFENRVPRVTSQLILLAQSGYYTNSAFHFVTDGERIQGGAPGGDPFDTTPSPLGHVDDQFHVDLQHNTTGVLSLAHGTLDDTGDSQFLITDGEQRDFDVEHSIAGLLVQGESVREAISQVSTNVNGRPLTPVVISSVDVIVDHENGVLMLSAAQGTSGSAEITVTVTDTDGNTDEQTFTATIQSDVENTPPWLADIPPVQTLIDTSVTLQLNAVDVEGDATSFFDESRLDMFGLLVPERSHSDLSYTVDAVTGRTTVAPTNGLSGTQDITVATAIQATAVDYQIMPIDILAAATPLTFSANDRLTGNDADDGNPDTFRLVRADDSLHVFINDELSYVAALDSVTTLTLNGSSDQDTLLIDLNGGDPVPSGGVSFNSGLSTTDVLEVTGNVSVSIERDIAAETISINGKSISLAGVQMIVDTAAVDQRSFSFGSDDDVIVFGDDDVAANGVSRLTNSTTGFSFDFSTPTQLSIRSGEGADIVTVVSPDGPAPDVTLIGGSGDDTLTGGEGNDRLDGEAGSDLLTGGSGNDFLIGKGDNDTLFGGDGDDQLLGSAGKDDLSGDAGNDLILGQGSTGDTLRGGDGDDTLDGGSGNDIVIESVAGSVIALATSLNGRGDDVLTNIERIHLTGSAAADHIDASLFDVPGFAEVTLFGGGGDDSLIGSAASDQLTGNGGHDTLIAGGGRDRLYGGSGRDRLYGEGGNDKVLGNGGSGDWVSGGEGDDTIKGGAGVDRLVEAADVNFVLTDSRLTGLGTDVVTQVEAAALAGGVSDNVIDTSTFSRGFVLLYGLDGNDSLIAGPGHDQLWGGSGLDTLHGGDGVDTLRGGEGNDGLDGGEGNDSLFGEADDDTLFGGELDDTLNGGPGDDLIVGELGDDQINGDDDSDILVGGSGDGTVQSGDFFDDLTERIDDYFLSHPLPDWVV
jgi:Ca2+-binding RTX toxin-like protein